LNQSNEFRIRLKRNLLGKTSQKGIVTLADQAIVSITNFLTGVIIGRTCVKEEFGLYMLGFSILILLTDIQNRLISLPYMIYSPHLNQKDLSYYTGSIIIHQLIFSIITILCISTTGIILSFGIGPKGLSNVFLTLASTITFILFREHIRRISFAQLKITRVIILDLSVGIIQIIFITLLSKHNALSASRSYLVVGFACGLISAGWLIWRWKDFSLKLTQVISALKQNWSFGKWLFGGSLIYMASTQLYPWLLAGFHGSQATAVFAACLGVVLLTNPFLIGFSNFFGPSAANIFARKGINELRQIVTKATVLVTSVVGLFCFVIAVFGEKIVSQVYGSKYANNGIIVTILALSVLTSAITLSVDLALLALKRPDANLKINIASFATTILFGLWLVKAFGPIGAAFGLLLANITMSIVRYRIFVIEVAVYRKKI
jgi:O-antigen/teichoic acid export membrane protein